MHTYAAVALLAGLALGCAAPALAQEAAPQQAPAAPQSPAAPQPPDAPAAPDEDLVRVSDSAVGIPNRPELKDSEVLNGYEWDDVLLFAWDIPQYTLQMSLTAMTPEAFAAQMKMKEAKFVSADDVEVDGSSAKLFRIQVTDKDSRRDGMMLVIGDEHFSSILAALGKGEIPAERAEAIRSLLLKAAWDPDYIAASITDNLNYDLIAPAPLRFVNKGKHSVIFTDATGKADGDKFIFVVATQEAKPARQARPAFNLSRFAALQEYLANPRSPEHHEFKYDDYNGLTTTVEGDGPNGGGPRVAIMHSIFLPTGVYIVEGVAPKARAEDLKNALTAMMESMEFKSADGEEPEKPVKPDEPEVHERKSPPKTEPKR